MQVASTARLSRVINLLRLQNFNSLSSLQYSAYIRQLDATMAKPIFKGHTDYYNGVTIDSAEEACDNKIFAQRLKGNNILSVISFCSCFVHSQIKL